MGGSGRPPRVAGDTGTPESTGLQDRIRYCGAEAVTLITARPISPWPEGPPRTSSPVLAKLRPFPELIKGFKFQSRRDDCWAVCIHNILKELSERVDKPAICIGESKLNRAMGYGGGYGALSIRIDRVAPNINKQLKSLGYELQERTDVGFDKLVSNLASQGLSYPIAGLSYEYLRSKRTTPEIAFEEQIPEGIDHAVVVFEANQADVTVFDPMERFGKAGKGGDGIITLTTPRFLSLWSSASVDREWLMYISPIPKRGSRTLDFDWEKANATEN